MLGLNNAVPIVAKLGERIICQLMQYFTRELHNKAANNRQTYLLRTKLVQTVIGIRPAVIIHHSNCLSLPHLVSLYNHSISLRPVYLLTYPLALSLSLSFSDFLILTLHHDFSYKCYAMFLLILCFFFYTLARKRMNRLRIYGRRHSLTDTEYVRH